MTIRPDAPKRFSAMTLASAIGLAPLLVPLLADSSVQAAACPESHALVFTAERPPSQMSGTPMPEIAIGDQAVFRMAGGTRCGPYDRVTGFQLMSSSASAMTMPPHPFRLAHEDAKGNRVETGLETWPASDGSTDVFDGRDPRGLWQVARIPPDRAAGPQREHFRLTVALAANAQPEPAIAALAQRKAVASDSTGARSGAGSIGTRDAVVVAAADSGPAMTSDPGPAAPQGAGEGQPGGGVSEEPQVADDGLPVARSFPGLPTMPVMPTGPAREDVAPIVDPQDTSRFMPGDDVETVSDGYLEAPRRVEAGLEFTARWDDRLSRHDRVTIVPEGTPDNILGEGQQNIRVGNNSRRTLRAPDALGTYELRYFSDDEQRVHARVTVEVRDPHIEISVDEELHAGRDFTASWDRRLSRHDRITIVPHDAPEDALGEGSRNIRIGNNERRVLHAPDELGIHEVRYWRNRQERVVGSALVNVVDPEIELDAPDTAIAGTDFTVGWDQRLSRHDRVTIVPLGAPDDVLGEGQQSTRVGNNERRTLRAPDTLGAYEVRYWRNAQERVVGREIIDVIDPEILVMAPPQVEAGSEFEVSWNERISRHDRITMVPAGSPEEMVGSGEQNARIGNNQRRTLRAPGIDGEYEVRYWRNAQERPAGRALVTVVPEGAGVATTDQDAGSAQDLIALMERLVERANRLDDVPANERRAIRNELIAFGPPGLQMLGEFMASGRIEPWQAAGFMGGSFDPPPPPAVRPYTGFVPPAAGMGGSAGQAPAQAGQGDAPAPAQPRTRSRAQDAAEPGALGQQDERRVVMLIARLEGAAPEAQQAIIDALAGYGSPATDILLEMMQDGLIDRALALRAAAAIEADGETQQDRTPQDRTQEDRTQLQQAPVRQAPVQQVAQTDAQRPAVYQVTGVTADDMLNVRDRPGVPGSTVIGRLAPDARNVERSGDVQDVGGRAWWHIRHPSLPADGGWVNARFLAAQGDVAETAPDGRGKPFTEAEGYTAIDHGAVLDRLLGTLPQTSAIFPPGGQLNPLTKAILMLENEEGVAAHARYRIRYAMEGRDDGTGGPPVTYSFVAIDRYNLGAAFREAVAESSGEARTPPPESFGAGEHVAYRMEFRPIQGRVADPVAMSRRVISDDEARSTRCLTLPCLDLASAGDEAMPWRAHDGSGTDFDRPYEDIRNEVYTPATMADLLVLESGAARISDGRLRWTGFEQSESVRPGEPFFEIVMDVNLAQDFGIEAVSWYGNLMDDSVAAIWQRAMTFADGDAAPQIFMEQAFECARGTPGPTGLCP